MARTVKPCIGYFSHDVDMMQDKKIKIIKAKHGLLGYAVYLRLLEETYRSDGYFLKADEDFNILFPDENNLNIESYMEILGDCLSKGLFSEELYSKYSILTSERIQKNYCDAISRRTSITFIKEYLMVEPFELLKTNGSDGTLKIDVNILSLNVDNLTLNVDGGTQIKEEENKTNKNKEKEIKKEQHSGVFSEKICEIVDYLNQVLDSNYQPTTKETQTLIKARLKEGRTIEDFKQVIDTKYAEWIGDEKTAAWLRPSTLFGNKFESYLNQKTAIKKNSEIKNQFLGKAMEDMKDEQARNNEVIGDYQSDLPGLLPGDYGW